MAHDGSLPHAWSLALAASCLAAGGQGCSSPAHGHERGRGIRFPGQAEPAGADLTLACAVNAAWNALTYVCDPELGL